MHFTGKTLASILCFILISTMTGTVGAQPQFLLKWGSNGTGDGQFDGINGVATDAIGNVYITDWGLHRIQKFDGSGNFITEWGSQGSGDGQFSGTVGVVVDAAGYVYVTELGNHRIQKFDGNGGFITKWGSQGSGDGQFESPNGVAVDAAGNILVVDNGNHRIQEFDNNGGFITTWGSQGSADGEFDLPADITVDASGNVYVTDVNNYRVQKFGTGPVLRVAPMSIEYGNVAAGSSTDEIVTITNEGNADLEILDLSLADGNAGFSIVQPQAPISPGGDSTVTVGFGPVHLGAVTDTLVISHNAGGGPFMLPLSAFGIIPAILTIETVYASPGGQAVLEVTVDTPAPLAGFQISIQPIDQVHDTDCFPSPAGLIGWWDADTVSGTIAYDIQDGNDGEMFGGVGIASGKVGNAFSLDGADDYISGTLNDFAGGNAAITTEAWFNQSAVTGHPGKGIVGVGGPSNGQHFFQRLAARGSDSIWDGGDGQNRLWIGVDDGIQDKWWASNTVINTNQWYHVVTTYFPSSNEVKIYINGALDRTIFLSADLNLSNVFRIGNDIYGDNPFNGFIDEVSIYDRALTASEIQAIYDAGSAGKCKWDIESSGYVTFLGAINDLETHGFTLAHSTDEDGVTTILLFNDSGGFIDPGQHNILALVYGIDPDTPLPHGIDLHVSDVILSDPEAQEMVYEVEDGAILIGVPGDIAGGTPGGDGTVNILDVIKVVKYIIGVTTPPDQESYLFWAVDLNGDGSINVLDLVSMINIVLYGPPDGNPPVKTLPSQPVTVSLEGVHAGQDGRILVPLMLASDGEIAGVQASFTFDPSGLSVGTPQLVDRAAGLTLQHHVSGGTLHLLAYSVDGQTITAGSGVTVLIPVQLLGDDTAVPVFTLDRAILSDARAQIIPVTIGTNSVKVTVVPTAFALDDAVPNPFNPSTTISYDVPQQAHITLIIYNLLGQEVVRLVDKAQAPGRYRAVWHGTNTHGWAVASGIYLYRMTSSTGYAKTKRMTMVK